VKVLDLFSGIGGFSLGLKWAGFQTVAFCEIDPYCIKVLKKNFPGVRIHENIKELDGNEYKGIIDVITGGYPCQPFSQAGNRKGHEDDRHLWPEMFRIIKQSRPAWVICENVNGHVTMGLDKVLFDLESEGYAARTFVIPACAIDAPHRRDRVWIVANTISNGIGTNAGAQPRAEEKCQELLKKDWETLPDDANEICSALADTKGEHDGLCYGKKKKGQKQKFRNSGVKEWKPWPVEPSVGRVADGIPGRVDRIKGLGNAVVPQIVQRIGLSIRRAHGQGTHDDTRKP